ncbi:BTB/POZ domain with WD40/YVTN repeat-like protein [Striga asiatica]|uniref:BTB/POZ domain with WD40/YVTN repeat-like protein n=1 Tax=Striga asiatica TaxID=4170 RepID=A0A5A7R8H2_STRAF|nr:BTB/POZ domain with WD40/YVTN repeat-like protein [Striga asiatica]
MEKIRVHSVKLTYNRWGVEKRLNPKSDQSFNIRNIPKTRKIFVFTSYHTISRRRVILLNPRQGKVTKEYTFLAGEDEEEEEEEEEDWGLFSSSPSISAFRIAVIHSNKTSSASYATSFSFSSQIWTACSFTCRLPASPRTALMDLNSLSSLLIFFPTPVMSWTSRLMSWSMINVSSVRTTPMIGSDISLELDNAKKGTFGIGC